jgi:hypothetical protein
MELSELLWWNGKYITVCDYTGLDLSVCLPAAEKFVLFYLSCCSYHIGINVIALLGIVYKLRPTRGDSFPRFILADGDGLFVPLLHRFDSIIPQTTHCSLVCIRCQVRPTVL